MVKEQMSELKILHTDDSEEFLGMAERFYQSYHREIKVFGSTEIKEALSILEKRDIDCIVADYDLDGTDGLDFLQKVRKQNSDIPFILFTGKGSEEVASEAISAGVTDYLQKKGSRDQFEVLLNQVENAVERKNTESALKKSEEKYRTLFENANDAIFLLDGVEIVDCNEAVEKMLGYDKEDIKGGTPLDISPETQPDGEFSEQKMEKKIEKALSGLNPVFEWELKNVRNEAIKVEVSLNRVKLGDNVQVQAILRDLTGVERAIEPLHNYTRSLMDAESVQEVLQEASNAAEEILGFAGSAIRKYNREEDILEIKAMGGTVDGVNIEDRPPFSLEDSPHGKAFRKGETVIDDIEESDGFSRDVFSQSMYVPIGDYGILSLGITEGEFTDKDIRLAEILAKNTQTAIQRVKLIEELRRREEESEKKYSTLVEEASDPVFIVKDGKFVFVNQRVSEIVKVPRDQMIGQNFLKYVAEEDREKVIERHRKRMEGKEEVESRYEITVVNSEGEELRVQLNTSLIEYEGENATMVIARDVSELQEREKTLLSMYNSTRNLLDAPGRSKVTEIALQTVKNVLGFKVAAIYLYDAESETLSPEKFTEEAGNMFEESLPTYTEKDTEVWNAFKQRSSLEIEGNESLNHGSGSGNSMVFSLGEHGVLFCSLNEDQSFSEEDIHLGELFSLSVAAALYRVEYEEEIKKERDRFAVLFEDIPDPAVYFEFRNGSPIVEMANQAFEQVFGFKEEDMKGNSLDKYVVPEQKMEEAENINQKVLEGRQLETEVRRKTVDGTKDFLLRGAMGESHGKGYAIYTDISEQKKRQREIEKQKEKLENFASVLSHDLRNPLNVAMGYTDLLEEEYSEEVLEEIKDAHSRMKDIMDDIMDLAKSSKPIDDREELSLEEVATSSWSNVETEDGSLVVDGDMTVNAHLSRLSRVFENLFRNAVEHGPENLEVRIGELENVFGQSTGFFVENTGDPIPEDKHEKIFEYGYSGSEGTGIGLSIVEGIVEAHGWDIRVADEQPRGPRFEIITDSYLLDKTESLD